MIVSRFSISFRSLLLFTLSSTSGKRSFADLCAIRIHNESSPKSKTCTDDTVRAVRLELTRRLPCCLCDKRQTKATKERTHLARCCSAKSTLPQSKWIWFIWIRATTGCGSFSMRNAICVHVRRSDLFSCNCFSKGKLPSFSRHYSFILVPVCGFDSFGKKKKKKTTPHICHSLRRHCRNSR